MKKKYLKPEFCVVSLYTDHSLLVASNGVTNDDGDGGGAKDHDFDDYSFDSEDF